jgi:hypothetical protein
MPMAGFRLPIGSNHESILRRFLPQLPQPLSETLVRDDRPSIGSMLGMPVAAVPRVIMWVGSAAPLVLCVLAALGRVLLSRLVGLGFRSSHRPPVTVLVPGLPMVAVHRDNEPLNPHPWLVPSRRVGTPLSLLSTPNLGVTQTGQLHRPSLSSPFGRSYAGINPPVDSQSVAKPFLPRI